MARGLKRRVLARILLWSGVIHATAVFRRSMGRGGPLYLVGHRVLSNRGRGHDDVDRMALLSGHAITSADLARRLNFLIRWVARPGDPADLRGGCPDSKAFYLTFDDGYLDNLTVAAPVLNRVGVRAVIFVVARLIHNPCSQPWWDRWGAEALRSELAPLDVAVQEYGMRCTGEKARFKGLTEMDLAVGLTRKYLNRSELLALPETFYVANHTGSHANLTLLDDEGIEREVALGENVVLDHPRRLPVFAYPFGAVDDCVAQAVDRSGAVVIAFATGAGRTGDRLRERRVNLNLDFALFAASAVGLLR